MKSLRIVFVSRSLPFHGLGGMETVAWDLARAFAARGHDVSALTTACPALRAYQDVEGVHIHCLDVPSGKYSRQWWREAARFFGETFRGSVDVVLSVSAGAMSIAAARDAAESTRYFVQAHGTAWGEVVSKLSTMNVKNWLKALIGLRSLVDDRGYRHFDAIISVGPRVTGDLTRSPTRDIIGNLPVHEISNGVDVAKFRYDEAARQRVRAQYGIADTAPVILTLSRLHAQKGIQHALQGFARALKDHPDARCLVVGSGPHEHALRDLTTSLRLKSEVIFTGAVDRESIGALYSAADIFIFTSTRIEGLPLNVLEALANGLPVIVSSHIALAGQGHQRVVDPRNYDQVGGAIAEAIRDHDDTARGCYLDQTYWLDTSVEKYLSLFELTSTDAARGGT